MPDPANEGLLSMRAGSDGSATQIIAFSQMSQFAYLLGFQSVCARIARIFAWDGLQCLKPGSVSMRALVLEIGSGRRAHNAGEHGGEGGKAFVAQINRNRGDRFTCAQARQGCHDAGLLPPF